MSENAIITAASVIGAGLVCLGAAMGAGFGNGNMCGKSIESMARQPEVHFPWKILFQNLLIELVCIAHDALDLLGVLMHQVVFANPFIK